MKKIGVLLAAVVPMALCATEYTWNGNESDDPMEKSNYKVGSAVATELPGAGDTLFLTKGAVWRITDSDESFDQFKDLAIIAGMDSSVVRGTSTVIVEVASSTAAMSSAFTASSGSVRYPTLRKLGAGTLSLTGKAMKSSSNRYYDQYCALSVEEGTLVLPQDAASAKNSYLGSADVGPDGTLVLYGNGGYTYVDGALAGSGLITNYHSGTSRLYVTGGPGVFSGRIQGTIDLYLTGDLRLTGTQNSCTLKQLGGFKGTDGEGTIGANLMTVEKDDPSSVALGDGPFALGGLNSAARVLFCGNSTAQTVGTSFYVFSGEDAPTAFDAGTYGDVTFMGDWALPKEGNEAVMMHRICLTGSNTEHECVLDNKFFNRDRDEQTYTAHITKNGSGIWHFKHNAERELAGGIAVEDGTLRFDTIAEKGEICSLGTSTILYEPFTGLFDDAVHPPVPYAFRLGGGDDPTKEGVFEYTGTAAVSITSRTAVVSGRARLRNASGKSFDFSGVSSIGASGGTLTLDGTGTDDVLRDVSDGDGAGPLGIVKDGVGTWALDGDLESTGPIAAKAGTLVINGNRDYKWFKFTFKENHSTVSNLSSAAINRTMYLTEIGLYSADGTRQNKLLTAGEHLQVGEYEGTLRPGEAAYGMNFSVVDSNTVTNLFDVSRNTVMKIDNGSKLPNRNDESTWVSVVMRLADTAAPVCSFDYGSPATGSGGNTMRPHQGPLVFSLAGSADGIHWTDVYSTEEAWIPNGSGAAYSKWWNGGNTVGASGKPETENPCLLQNAAHETRMVLPNGMAASVDAGATLKVVGDTLTVKKLILDAAAGVGTIENVDFAATGVIDIRNFTGDSLPKFKYTLQNVTGFSNVANWTVQKNGVETRHLSVSAADDGTITITRSGMVLIVR